MPMRRAAEAAVPRLMGTLERDGRTVRPCLVHGDLWKEPREDGEKGWILCLFYLVIIFFSASTRPQYVKKFWVDPIFKLQ